MPIDHKRLFFSHVGGPLPLLVAAKAAGVLEVIRRYLATVAAWRLAVGTGQGISEPAVTRMHHVRRVTRSKTLQP